MRLVILNSDCEKCTGPSATRWIRNINILLCVWDTWEYGKTWGLVAPVKVCRSDCSEQDFHKVKISIPILLNRTAIKLCLLQISCPSPVFPTRLRHCWHGSPKSHYQVISSYFFWLMMDLELTAAFRSLHRTHAPISRFNATSFFRVGAKAFLRLGTTFLFWSVEKITTWFCHFLRFIAGLSSSSSSTAVLLLR
jgi:hypothetical protein